MKTRFPAEWEAQSGVMLTWPHEATDWATNLQEVQKTYVAIASEILKRERLLIVCHNAAFIRAQLPHEFLHRAIIKEVPTNDTWARDHAPITVIQEESPLLLDCSFNGWGLKYPANLDNQINRKLRALGVFEDTLFETLNFVLEGGAIETDGQSTLLTTEACLLSPNRNPEYSKEEIEHVLKKYLGIRRILWLKNGYLAGDDTDSHIDTLARFCSPDTIAYIQCDDPTDEHFESLQRMEHELSSFQTRKRKPYHLVPLPMPKACFVKGERKPATYANFLIINGAVLVPLYSVPQDSIAIEQLQKVFSDRQVIGLDCRPLIEQNGSLHCISMQFPQGVL